MSERKPVLPAIRNRMAARNDREDAEIRAAEAVIRAARRDLRAYDGEGADEQWDSAERLRSALARLDRVTGRGSK